MSQDKNKNKNLLANQNVFLFKKNRSSANPGLSLDLFFSINCPAALNTHSDGTDVAIVQKTSSLILAR
jgi:hypothetical protein